MALPISFFCSLFSIIGAVLYILLRTGFPTNHEIVYNTLGLSLLLLSLPALISKKIPLQLSVKWFFNQSFILLVLLITFCLLGLHVKGSSVHYPVFVTSAGYIMFGWMVVENFKTTHASRIVLTFISAVFFSVFIVSLIFSYHVKPLFYEDLFSWAYQWNVDTLYHIANAQMFNTYGVLSTGLDGAHYIPYHYGSHVLYTCLAGFLNIHLLDSYILLPAIFTGPVFIYTFLHLILQIKKMLVLPDEMGYAFILVLFVAFVGFIRNTYYGFGGDIPEYLGMLQGSPILFISDSYTVSLLFLNILLILVCNFYTNNARERTSNKSDYFFLWLVLPALFFYTGFCKISTLYIAFSVLAFLLVRLKLYRKLVFTLSFLIILISAIIVFVLTRDNKYGDGDFSLLYHFMEAGQNVFIFLILHFVWFWALLFLYLSTQSAGHILSVDSKRMSIEILLVMILSSLVPALLLRVKGGQLYYFTEIPSWYSVVVILAYLPLFHLKKDYLSKRLGVVKIVFVIILLTYLSHIFYKNIKAYTNQVSKLNYSTRYNMLMGPDGLLDPENFKLRKLRALDDSIRSFIQRPLASKYFDKPRITPAMQFISKLKALSNLPYSQKELSVVYVNFDSLGFPLPIKCYEKPLIVPALSGMASIKSGITAGCSAKNKWFSGYGYEYYEPLKTTDFDLPLLKSEVIKKGFRWLYYYDPKNDNFIKIDCSL